MNKPVKVEVKSQFVLDSEDGKEAEISDKFLIQIAHSIGEGLLGRLEAVSQGELNTSWADAKKE